MDFSKLFDLTGKNAMIIGGAGGLGKLVAQGLAECGANVAIASRTESKLQAACEELKALTGKEFKYYVCDATDEESVAAVAEQSNKDMGHIDILINSQGSNFKKPALEFPIDAFNKVLVDDITSLMITCKHFAKYMKDNGYGKIVNVTSVRGKIATKGPGNAAYCASKGAVDMLTKQLASEFGPYGITVNAVGPTVTETPMMKDVIEQRGGDAYLKSLADAVPMRKTAAPEDVVGTALFLAAPASDFLTGNILYPDGGLTCVG